MGHEWPAGGGLGHSPDSARDATPRPCSCHTAACRTTVSDCAPAVALAQLAEHRIVDPMVTGSSPVGHPNSPVAGRRAAARGGSRPTHEAGPCSLIPCARDAIGDSHPGPGFWTPPTWARRSCCCSSSRRSSASPRSPCRISGRLRHRPSPRPRHRVPHRPSPGRRPTPQACRPLQARGPARSPRARSPARRWRLRRLRRPPPPRAPRRRPHDPRRSRLLLPRRHRLPLRRRRPGPPRRQRPPRARRRRHRGRLPHLRPQARHQ
jgi:hypothetical protein